MYIDAHCHLADPRYSEALLVEVIKRSRLVRVTGWVQGGIHPKDWERQIEIQKLYGPGVITSFGLHPWWIASAKTSEIQEGMSQLEVLGKGAHAIGETGLDYQARFKASGTLGRQREAFEAQILLSKRLSKPLILHIVRAHRDAIYFLKKHAPYPKGGLVHSFSGSRNDAMEYLALGFLISFSGSVTRIGGANNAFQTLRKAIPSIPRDKIVIETDAPDQMPQLPDLGTEPGRSHPWNLLNEPANLIRVAESLSGLIGAEVGELLEISTRNITNLFGIAFWN